MATAHCVVTNTPKPAVLMLLEVLAGGDVPAFIDHLANFALPLAQALAEGAKIATGDDFLGYREVDITLFGPSKSPMPGLKISFVFAYEAYDIPTRTKLGVLAKLLRVESEEAVIDRTLYWLWVATQLASISRKVFIMHDARARWEASTYKPLWDARFRYRY